MARLTMLAASAVALTILLGGCSSKKKEDAAVQALGNSITRDLAKDHLGKLRKSLEAGEEVTYAKDCRPLKDLAKDLKTDTNPESAKLLTDIDAFCTHEIPAKRTITSLEKDLKDVKEHQNDEFWVKYLVEHCKGAEDDLKKAETDNAKDAPMVAALAAKRTAICTPENTTPAAKAAATPAKKKKKK